MLEVGKGDMFHFHLPYITRSSSPEKFRSILGKKKIIMEDSFLSKILVDWIM